MDEKQRKEWLLRRRNGIGASDSPQILGYSEWGSALSVYNQKIGEALDNDMSERMEIGLLIEDFIANLFRQQTGKKIARKNKEIYSKEYDFIFATIDRNILGENSILECKNIGIYNEKWDGQVPDIYNIQVQHQMYVTESDKAYIGALFSGNRFEIYEIERNQKMIDQFIPLLVDFWNNNVIKRIPPLANRNDSNYLLDINSNDNGIILDVNDPKIESIFSQYQKASKYAKEFKKKCDDLSSIIKQEISTNKGISSDNYNAIWNRFDVSRFDSKKFEKDHPDLYQKYVNESKSSRLMIKEKK